MRLQNQTAIVTGGSSGIGRAICIALAEEGANLVIGYGHDREGARETEMQCRAYGVNAICLQVDVAKKEDCDRLFEEALELNGRVDILVNNAGITKDNLLLRMSEEDFDKVLQVNLYGSFYCMKAAAKLMLRQKYGRIISISSVVGLYGNAGQVNYAAAKAGIIGMTKSLAKELARKKITVNAVAPGMIETRMTALLPDAVKEQMKQRIPCGRAGKAEEVAFAVRMLADPAASYITGQVISVDGGMN